LVLAPNKNPVALANKITELAVRLNVTEEQNRLLREENQRLQQVELAHEKLKSEHQQTVERKVLVAEGPILRPLHAGHRRGRTEPRPADAVQRG
jgi:hypothetical protein